MNLDSRQLMAMNSIISSTNDKKTLAETLNLICNQTVIGYSHPEKVMTRISYNNQNYKSSPFHQTPYHHQQSFNTATGDSYSIEWFYAEPPENELVIDKQWVEKFSSLVSMIISNFALEKIVHDNAERIKELNSLNLTRQILSKNVRLEESLQKICTLLPEAWQYPGYTAAKIILEDKVFKSRNFKKTPWVQRQFFETPDNKKGTIEIFYLKEFPQADEGPFLKEERNLIDNLAALITGSASQKTLQQVLLDNTERLKELKGINQTSAILKKGKTIEESLQLICSIIPEAWQYPDATVARISYNKNIFTSNHFIETKWVQKQEFHTPDHKKGLIEVFYTKEFPEADEGPFLKEERNLLINLTNLIAGKANKEILNDLLAKNRERLKELKAINKTSEIIAEGRSISETLQRIVNILPQSWQYPRHTTARISYEGKVYIGRNFRETTWRQKENFVTIDSKRGSVEIFYLKEFPNCYEGPFLKEERNLIINIAKLITGYLNNVKGREVFHIKQLAQKLDESKPEEYRKSLIDNKQPLQLFFNKQVIDKYIYLDMMKYKVKEILFVATLYDAFILENEDSFFEQFMGGIYQYSLFSLPRITGVTSEKEALDILGTTNFDLVILMVGLEVQAPLKLSKKIKQKRPDIPVYLLLNKKSYIKKFEETVSVTPSIDNLFVWSGYSQIFFSIVKSIEDKLNADNDTKIGLVRVILLVEDSAFYYSKYLQILYSIVFEQIQKLLPEVEKKELDKICKMRSRPKILHARNFEEAMYIIHKYEDFLLCVISDIEFEREGKIDPRAGITLIKYLQNKHKDLPIILQSIPQNAGIAQKLNVEFVNKNSENLQNELKAFLTNKIFFGDFVFKDKDGNQIAVARSLREFENLLQTVPDESLYEHGKENQFSLWLMSRGEIELAKHLNPVKISEFSSMNDFREHFTTALKGYRDKKKKGKVLSFDETAILNEKNIVTFSGGSLGGKGRGLAFLNALINNLDLSDISNEINIRVPVTAVIGTDEYEYFMSKNHINEYAFNQGVNYQKIQELFVKGHLSSGLMKKLEVFLDQITKPIAIRSSSISEDSITQPFAGVYDTFILPNNQRSKKVRLQLLSTAIKLVYASVFSDNARRYFKAIHHKMEDEKMAVVLQELVGNQYNNYYYPHVSGIAKSYNYYPIGNMKPEDGYSMAAVGLGFHVVSGKKSYRFCQKYPNIDMYTIRDLLSSTQVDFLAVDMNMKDIDLITHGEMAALKTLDIDVAEKHDNLKHCASVYVAQNDRIESGLNAPGPRVVNFSNILKYNYIPLAHTIDIMLNNIKEALGASVEIEYAVDLNKTINGIPSFYLLQIKPLVIEQQLISMSPEDIDQAKTILLTHNGLGNGIIHDITDVIYVDTHNFNKLKTLEMAREIEYLNNLMVQEDRHYILIGPGRWGTRDQYLGIPVVWPQISMARVIVEISLASFPLDSSLGSHFFHNVTSMNIGYFSVHDSSATDYIKWEVLDKQQIVQKTNYFKHIRFENPLEIIMLGKSKTSAILTKNNG